MTKKLSIKNWPSQDRPREKFLQNGWEALTHAEILAILLGTGTTDASAVDIAKMLLSKYKEDLSAIAKLQPIEMQKAVKGIGIAKAINILAALELGKRLKLDQALEKREISDPQSVFDLMGPILRDKTIEEFWVLFLNRQGKLLDFKKIFQGGNHGVYVDPKVIFKEALLLNSSAIIMVHNHPSGTLYPSQQDTDLTHKVFRLGKELELHLRDHVIIAGNRYYSFVENGIIG